MTRQIRIGKKDGARQEWRTPAWLRARVIDRYDIDLDAAAKAQNAIVPRYIAPAAALDHERVGAVATDATSTSWGRFGRRAWCNPPFGRVGAFVAAALESFFPTSPSIRPLEIAVFLLPASVDTAYFRRLVSVGAKFGFFDQRIAFVPPSVGIASDKGPAFPCMLAVVKAPKAVRQGSKIVGTWDDTVLASVLHWRAS